MNDEKLEEIENDFSPEDHNEMAAFLNDNCKCECHRKGSAFEKCSMCEEHHK